MQRCLEVECYPEALHRATLKHSLKREGILVAARSPRLKPKWTAAQAKARVEYCKKWCWASESVVRQWSSQACRWNGCLGGTTASPSSEMLENVGHL